MLRILMLLVALWATPALAADDELFPQVVMETSKGAITVELDRFSAPLTVAHFLKLVDGGSYDNTIFHRVIAGFVAQGGGIGVDGSARKEGDKLVNESGNGLSNSTGTLAMARQSDPHSATRQFYFNLADNANLDPNGRWGYTVFGRVIGGDEVLQAIGNAPTATDAALGMPDVPVEPIILKRVYRKTAKP